jgi:phosphoglycerol geranylgeranyltransferase
LHSILLLVKKNRKFSIYDKFIERKGQIALLIDPEKCIDLAQLNKTLELANLAQIDFIFIGGSTVSKKEFDFVTQHISKSSSIPLIIFPGGSHQISEHADALLYLSLLSGRNPDYLIGHHIQSASDLIKMNLEIIPTGYILIDGGKQSSVAYVSQTTPIPQDQTSIALNTAIAGKLQGKKIIFFDAGSGAKNSVPLKMIEQASGLNIPIFVGGGIKSIESIEAYKNAGANVIVIGNYIEENIDFLLDLKNYIKKAY